MELLILCCVFPKEVRKIFELRIFKSFTSRNQQSFCTKVFICVMHVLPPLLQFWRCSSEEDIQSLRLGRKGLMAGRMSRKLHYEEGTLVTIQLKNLLLENLRKICSYRYQYLLIAKKTQPRLSMPTNWKDTSHDLGEIMYVYWLEGHELWFDPRRHRPAYKDGTSQADVDDRYT